MENVIKGRESGSVKARQFVCGCGKAYLSNAALFTHVKQKHDGKPPEGIHKPITLYERRGRPSLIMIKQKQEELKSDKYRVQQGYPEEKTPPNPTSAAKFEQIFDFLKDVLKSEVIDPNLWTQVEAFRELHEYIDQKETVRSNNGFQFAGVRMGQGIAQFLRTISLNVQIEQFEQVVVIFMLLLQYVFDQSNKKSIIHEAPVQFLLPYINPFITMQLNNAVQDFKIGHLWVMRRQNAIKILFCFYHWLIMKNYTQYRVSLAQDYEDYDDSQL